MNTLFFLIGASGAGKTTAAKKLEESKISGLSFHYFDSIGVPSVEVMVKEYGSADEWQRSKTIEWAQKVKNDLTSTSVVLDAQTRPSFLEEACQKADIKNYAIILFDCSDTIRKDRLTKRNQPELANEQMMSWATYLRAECKQRECIVVDTSHLSVKEMTNELEKEIRKLISI
jgi:adenylate kinase family enzyme